VSYFSNRVYHSILNNRQYHLTPDCKEKAKTFVEGMEMLDFDGCSEILVDSFEDGIAFFKSEEYVQKMNSKGPSQYLTIVFHFESRLMTCLSGDEDNWLARPVCMMVGYDNLIYGKALPAPRTTDGILWSDMPFSSKDE